MISEGYVANGAKVYVSSRDAAACEAACRELNETGRKTGEGGEAHAIPADFYKLDDVKALARQLGEREKSTLAELPWDYLHGGED
jgi:NAD(P)-dependent dehydrogenase (short-subunit alcohol dehydrogenase family)